MKRLVIAAAVFVGVGGSARVASAADDAPFTFDPPGQLVDGSGEGLTDGTVYAPGMRFPMEEGPAYANSQVYGHGGSHAPPGGHGHCYKDNYAYPWRDNFCETRSWDMPLCPAGKGHQGQDIRPATCVKGVHWVVAAVDGTITHIGSYSVYLTAPDGTRFDYLHMSDVAVKEGDEVKRGQRIGKVSNEFGGTPTTIHLHFNIMQNVAGIGDVFVPPYTSLVRSYQGLLGLLPPEGDHQPIATAAPNEVRGPDSDDDPDVKLDLEVHAESGCASAPGSASSGAVAVIVGMLAAGAARRRRR